MLKHSRKFKLVPVTEEEDGVGVEEEGEKDYIPPPTPPVLKKLSKLDQQLRAILEDASLSDAEKMQQYESTLSKWGKFYRQYQSAESGGRDNTSLNNTTTAATTAAAFSPSSSTWHSTPYNNNNNRTILFGPAAAAPARSRSRSPLRRRDQSPSPIRPGEEEDYYATPRTSRKKKKKPRTPADTRRMTPAQLERYTDRLRQRAPYRAQVGSSWLPWRLNAPRRKRRRE